MNQKKIRLLPTTINYKNLTVGKIKVYDEWRRECF